MLRILKDFKKNIKVNKYTKVIIHLPKFLEILLIILQMKNRKKNIIN